MHLVVLRDLFLLSNVKDRNLIGPLHELIRRPSCARAQPRIIKWPFFVSHFRRRRRKSLDLVLLLLRGQQTQLHIRLTK